MQSSTLQVSKNVNDNKLGVNKLVILSCGYPIVVSLKKKQVDGNHSAMKQDPWAVNAHDACCTRRQRKAKVAHAHHRNHLVTGNDPIRGHVRKHSHNPQQGLNLNRRNPPYPHPIHQQLVPWKYRNPVYPGSSSLRGFRIST